MAKKRTAAQKRFDENVLLITALELIFKQLYEDYTLKTIEDIADTTSGGTPLRNIESYYGGEIPWIKSGELKDGLIIEAEEFITQEGLDNSSSKIYPAGTVVVAMYGANVGKTGILEINAASNQAVCAITPKTENITKKFLFWFFRYKRPEYLGASFGGAQPNISQKIIRETSIPIPPLVLQKNLSDFFDIVEQKQKQYIVEYPPLPEKFANILRIIKRVEVLAARVAKARSLRAEADRETENLPLAMRNVRFENHKEFERKKLVDLCTIVRGSSPRPQGDSRFYGGNVPRLLIADISRDGKYVTPKIDSLTEEGAKLSRPMPKGSLVIAISGSYGVPAFLAVDACIHDGFIGFRDINSSIDPEYLYQVLLLSRPYFDSVVKDSGLKNLTTSHLKNLQVPVPPLDEQRRIVAYLDSVQARLASLRELQSQAGEELDALLPSVLDKAFKGEL